VVPTIVPFQLPAAQSIQGAQVGFSVPEIVGISNWINTEPFTFEDLQGKVVLVDFWTYTCVNCIRTLPFIKEWHEKYADAGLVIVGLHAPEFEFEKDPENVQMAVEEFGLTYPNLQDNEMATWTAFQNQAWPAKYLIDKDGIVRYTHIGEGGYTETESVIRSLLLEIDADIDAIGSDIVLDPVYHDSAVVQDPALQLTRELYAGLYRNFGALQTGDIPPYILYQEYYENPDTDFEYVDVQEHLNQFLYIQGLWHNHEESLRHARVTENYEDYVLVPFRASEVNVVLALDETKGPYEVRALIDDAPIAAEIAGADIQYDSDGNSFLLVDEDRMYAVVALPEFEGHELKLSSNSDDFSVFAYTFGAYTELQPTP